MNIMIIIGLVLAGSTIAFDHLIHELPQWMAIVLYSTTMTLLILGMICSRRRTASQSKKSGGDTAH